MPTFKYTAHTPDGKKTTGTIEAPNSGRVAEVIKSFGFLPVKITEFRPSVFEREIALSFELITSKDILLFTRQLATLLGAGLTLLGSFDSILEQIEKKNMKEMLKEIRESVSGGMKFSDALKEHPKQFSPVYSNMVMVGEKGGLLVEILQRLAVLIEYEEAIKTKIKKATRYPVMVLVALGIAFVVLVVFVLPNFMGMFSMFGGDLPLPTKIMIGINHFLLKYWFIIIALVFGSIVGFKKYIQTDRGRYQWDNFTISMLLIGPLIKKMIISRFARVLAMLNQSGLSIVASVDIVAKTTNNVVISRALEGIKRKIQGGKGISEPMRESGIFPATVVNMVAVGEKSGNLSDMLSKVADYFDEEVDVALDNLSSMIEPILIGFLAIIVLFVALAVFLPMWNMVTLMK